MLESNKLIAEFLGLETQVFNSGILNYKFGGAYFEAEELSFYISWDWLMLVVDKIESLDNIISFKIASYIEILYWTNTGVGLISITDIKPKIEATYNACVEFIKWYNENGG